MSWADPLSSSLIMPSPQVSFWSVRLPIGAEPGAVWTGQQWELIEEREPEGGNDGYSWSSGVTCEIIHWRHR